MFVCWASITIQWVPNHRKLLITANIYETTIALKFPTIFVEVKMTFSHLTSNARNFIFRGNRRLNVLTY